MWVYDAHRHTNRPTDESMHIPYLGQTPVSVRCPAESLDSLNREAEADKSTFRIAYSTFRREAEAEAEAARQQTRPIESGSAASSIQQPRPWHPVRKSHCRRCPIDAEGSRPAGRDQCSVTLMSLNIECY